jgi:hypothetical protein
MANSPELARVVSVGATERTVALGARAVVAFPGVVLEQREKDLCFANLDVGQYDVRQACINSNPPLGYSPSAYGLEPRACPIPPKNPRKNPSV